MTESEQKTIKHLHQILIIAIGLLVVAEVSTLVMSNVKYVFTVIVAGITACVQWIYWHKKGDSSVRKIMVITVLLLTLLSPLIFVLVKVLFLGESVIQLEIAIVASFVIPILLMLYIDKRLTQLC